MTHKITAYSTDVWDVDTGSLTVTHDHGESVVITALGGLHIFSQHTGGKVVLDFYVPDDGRIVVVGADSIGVYTDWVAFGNGEAVNMVYIEG